MNYNLPIIILAVLCIIVLSALLSRKQTEHFSGGSGGTIQCPFTPGSEADSKEGCLTKCLNKTSTLDNDAEKKACLDETTGCIKICTDSTPNPCSYTGPGGKELTKCIINNHTDIYGDDLGDCIKNCKSNTCSGCTNFKIFDQNNGRIVSGEYTQSLKDFNEKCTPDPYNHQYCSPCVEACKTCTDINKCRWKNTVNYDKESREKFNQAEFKIGVLPDDKSALIVWNEERNDVDKYHIYIYKKSDLNLTDDPEPRQKNTPLTVKTITKQFQNMGSNSHVISGLTNGETYAITINKISTHVKPQEVKVSNTIEVVPSTVKLVDFSKLSKDNSLKQKNLLSIGVFNELKGKTLDLTL